MLILVSGSRHARPRHAGIVRATLLAAAPAGVPVVLRHGAAPGVDTLAGRVAAEQGWRVEAVRAGWRRCDPSLPAELGGCPPHPHRRRRDDGTDWCPYAGPRRNQQMVDQHPTPDLVVVFPAADRPSPGTWDLHTRATRAGLRVHDPVRLEVTRG